MLVLTRKAGQSIMIGDDIEVVVTSVEGDGVRVEVGFRSPLGERMRVAMHAPRAASARSSQSIMLGTDVGVSVLSVIGEKVRIGIQAPRTVPVYRSEVYAEIQREQQAGFVAPEVMLAQPPPMI
jgi:carbon storage regulator CsrA